MVRQAKSYAEENDKYLNVKYLLSKIHYVDFIKGMMMLQSKANLKKQEKERFKDLNFTLEDCDYTKGYNKGDAHPTRIEPGQYYIRIEPETSPRDTIFTIQYISHENINFKPVDLSS